MLLRRRGRWQGIRSGIRNGIHNGTRNGVRVGVKRRQQKRWRRGITSSKYYLLRLEVIMTEPPKFYRVRHLTQGQIPFLGPCIENSG